MPIVSTVEKLSCKYGDYLTLSRFMVNNAKGIPKNFAIKMIKSYLAKQKIPDAFFEYASESEENSAFIQSTFGISCVFWDSESAHQENPLEFIEKVSPSKTHINIKNQDEEWYTKPDSGVHAAEVDQQIVSNMACVVLKHSGLDPKNYSISIQGTEPTVAK